MNGMMKAAVFRGVETLVVEEMPIPECPDDGVLVKVRYCGICGGDIRGFYNGLRDGVSEQVMGHEISGDIVEVGLEVTTWKVGDRVALAPDISCGTCWYCRRGLVNLCQHHRLIGTHIKGGFAQYIVLPGDVVKRGFIERIPEGMSYREAAFCEPVSGVAACHRRIQTSSGDRVVIIGDGPIGLLHIEMAHAFGAEAIILGRRKLERAKQFEPELMIDNTNPDEAIKAVLDYTDGLGADIVVVATPTLEPQMEALHMVRKRGIVVLYGGAPKNAHITQLDSNLIHYNELTVTGSFSYPATGLEDALQMVYTKKVHAEKYLKMTVPLSGIADGIRSSKRGEAIKVLVDPWLE